MSAAAAPQPEDSNKPPPYQSTRCRCSLRLLDRGHRRRLTQLAGDAAVSCGHRDCTSSPLGARQRGGAPRGVGGWPCRYGKGTGTAAHRRRGHRHATGGGRQWPDLLDPSCCHSTPLLLAWRPCRAAAAGLAALPRAPRVACPARTAALLGPRAQPPPVEHLARSPRPSSAAVSRRPVGPTRLAAAGSAPPPAESVAGSPRPSSAATSSRPAGAARPAAAGSVPPPAERRTGRPSSAAASRRICASAGQVPRRAAAPF